MSSRETIRLPFSSNWTGPVMPAISTFNKEKKTKIMVKFVWKSLPFSEEIECLEELYLLKLNTTSPTRMPNDKLFQSIKQTINLF